jgi:hypothetical protein
MTKNPKITRKCLNVAIYDYDTKSMNILKSGFLRKKNHRFYGNINHFNNFKGNNVWHMVVFH